MPYDPVLAERVRTFLDGTLEADRVADDAGLERWVGRGRDFAASLPIKPKKK